MFMKMRRARFFAPLRMTAGKHFPHPTRLSAQMDEVFFLFSLRSKYVASSLRKTFSLSSSKASRFTAIVRSIAEFVVNVTIRYSWAHTLSGSLPC